jgi:hypothetical protein
MKKRNLDQLDYGRLNSVKTSFVDNYVTEFEGIYTNYNPIVQLYCSYKKGVYICLSPVFCEHYPWSTMDLFEFSDFVYLHHPRYYVNPRITNKILIYVRYLGRAFLTQKISTYLKKCSNDYYNKLNIKL